MFYRACTVLASEEQPSHTILDMGICTKRLALLASDWTNFSSSQSPSTATHQHLNLDFSVLADPSVDWNPTCLDTLDLESCEGCYGLIHGDILMEPLSTGSFASLLLEVSDYRQRDLYLYRSFELRVLFFEPTMVYGLMCQNWSPGSNLAPLAIAHVVLMVQDYTVFDL